MQMKCPVTSVGIPQDVVDAANAVKMDAETLVKLCVAHSVAAVKDMLAWAASKLPASGTKPAA